MGEIGSMRQPLAFGIDHNIDLALAEPLDALAAMLPGPRKAQLPQQGPQRFRLGFVGRELDKRHAIHRDPWRQGRVLARHLRLGLPHLVHQENQRAMPVLGNGARRPGAELVVEDFQRERSVISRCRYGPGKIHHRQIAFSRHIAEVPAPIEQIHVQRRRVGQLHDEDLVPGMERIVSGSMRRDRL